MYGRSLVSDYLIFIAQDDLQKFDVFCYAKMPSEIPVKCHLQ